MSSLFCDVYFTPHSDNSHVYQLSFDWKGVGESCCDYLEVFLHTDTEPDSSWEMVLGRFNQGNNWQKAVINIPDYYGNLSGEKSRLVFRWVNDSSVEGQPPAAVDNIKIRSVDPNEALLSSLAVSEGILSPAFDPNTFNYQVTVINSVTDITVDASAMRSVDGVSGTGIYPLNEGNNPFEIVVSNPEGTVQNTYNVTVNRMKPAFNVPFTEDFESTTTFWNFANGNEINQWHIGTATAASGDYSAYISDDGGISNSCSSGSSLVHLFCDVYFTPPAGSEYGYYQLSFNWKGGDYNYLAVYLTDTATVPVAGNWPVYNLSFGQFSGSDTWQKAAENISDYHQGNMYRLLFVWYNYYSEWQMPIAIDNITLKYVTLTDATLSKLSVNSGVLSPVFDPNTFNYTVNVDKSVSRIRLDAEANNANATIAGANEEFNLNTGSNTFHILVLAENINYRNTYTVVVNRGGTDIESPETAIRVYPNPTTGKLFIENAEKAEIVLYNLPGEILLRTRESTMDLSGYPDGIYLLQIGDKKIKVVKR
jgi:hypothetical protein